MEEFAVQSGQCEVWVAAGGPAVPFYEACGYVVQERLSDSTILRKIALAA